MNPIFWVHFGFTQEFFVLKGRCLFPISFDFRCSFLTNSQLREDKRTPKRGSFRSYQVSMRTASVIHSLQRRQFHVLVDCLISVLMSAC